MGHVSIASHIDAPRDLVWELAVDCSRELEWNVSFVEIRGCQGRYDQLGIRYTGVARVLGRNIEAEWETTRVEPGKLIEQQGTAAGGSHATMVATCTDAGGGTEMVIEFEYQLPGGLFSGVLERLAASAIERDVRHSNENFKALCEAEARERMSMPAG